MTDILDQFKGCPTIEVETKDGPLVLYGREPLTDEEETVIKDVFRQFTRKEVCASFKLSGFKEYRTDQ